MLSIAKTKAKQKARLNYPVYANMFYENCLNEEAWFE